MKKEYIVGGLLGVVLCGIVAYAVMTFIGMEDSEIDQPLAQQLPGQPVPLDAIVQETRQPAKDPLPDQGKAKVISPTSGPTDRKKTDELRAEGTNGVMITLKSGRAILADACREFGSQLSCDMTGGAITVEREDIESIKEIKIVKRFAAEAQTTAGTVAGPDNRDTSGKVAANSNVPAQEENSRLSNSLTPEQIKRHDQIITRKTIFQTERERLIKEREKLHEDVKNQGTIKTQAEYDALKERIAALEARINGFNDEVKRLNEEEAKLFEASGNRQQ